MKLNLIPQVGLVVRDADAAFARFEQYFGADRSQLDISDSRDPNLRCRDFTAHGEPQLYKGRFLCFPLGGIEVELIQPLDDKGPYAEFLAEHGDGIHHLLFRPDDPDAFEQIMAETGSPLIASGHIESTDFRYFDGRDVFGMILELCRRAPF